LTIRMAALSLASAWGFWLRRNKPVSFAKDIEPVLQASCWKCHGSAIQLSKLDLRTRDAALKGGEKGPAIVPRGAPRKASCIVWVAGIEKPSIAHGWQADGRANFPPSRTGLIRGAPVGSDQRRENRIPAPRRPSRTCRFRPTRASIGRSRNLVRYPVPAVTNRIAQSG